MPFYCTIDTVPELVNFPKDERRRIWRKRCYRALGSWQGWGCVAIDVAVTISGVIIGAADARCIPPAYMQPDAALFLGAMLGLLAGGTAGVFLFTILLCNMVRKSIRKTGSNGLNWVLGGPLAPGNLYDSARRDGSDRRWSWIGCAGGALGGSLLGLVVGALSGFVAGGPWGALFGFSLGIIGGGDVGCVGGGFARARTLAPRRSASRAFSSGFRAGAVAVALVIVILAVVMLAEVQVIYLLAGGAH